MSDQDEKPQDLTSGRNPRKRQFPVELPLAEEESDEDEDEDLEEDFEEENHPEVTAASAAAALNQMTNLLPPAFQELVKSPFTMLLHNDFLNIPVTSWHIINVIFWLFIHYTATFYGQSSRSEQRSGSRNTQPRLFTKVIRTIFRY